MDDDKDQKLKAGAKLVLELDKLVDSVKSNIKENKELGAWTAEWFGHRLADYSLAVEFKTLEGDFGPFTNVKWKRGHRSFDDEDHVRDELAIAFEEQHEDHPDCKSYYRYEIYNHWQVDGEFGFDNEEDPGQDQTSVVAIGKHPNVLPWQGGWQCLPRNREFFATLLFNVLAQVSHAKDRLNHDHLKHAIQEAMDKYDPEIEDE